MDKQIFISEDFDKQQTTTYTLLIGVEHATVTLAAVDGDANLKFFAMTDPGDPDQQVTDLLACTFKSVKIIAADQGYSFVPDEAYDANFLPVYKRFLPGEGIAAATVSHIPSQAIRLICQINMLGLEPYVERFPGATVYPRIHAYVCGIDKLVDDKEYVLTVDRHTASGIAICCFNKGKLCYCNDFEVHSPDDLHYYMLALRDHIGLSDSRPAIILSGHIANDDPYYKCLTNYSDTLVWANVAQPTGLSLPLDLQHEQHRSFSLFASQLCG